MTIQAGLGALLLVVLGSCAASAGPTCGGRHWVGAWETSPSDGAGRTFTEQSLRLIVRPTLGGRRVRVRLSNRFGAEPVTFGAAFLARRDAGATLVRGSGRRLRFAGRTTVTVPAGGEVVSDGVRAAVEPFQDLAVSLYVMGTPGAATEHFVALQTSFVSPSGSGDHTADAGADAFAETIPQWPYVTGVEVRAPAHVGAVVAVGDSITDGFPSGADGNARYPDYLARRLAKAKPEIRLAVQNAGISGNRVLSEGLLPVFGPRLLDRLERDVATRAGATVAIVQEGTNDLGSAPLPTAAEVVAGLQTVVDRLHAAGLRVLLGTQTPCTAFRGGLHGSVASIALRNQINAWIRTGGAADGVVDFHAALRDAADPDRLRAEFDSGDHLHPNPAGYEAMADAVDLELLRSATCGR